MSKIQDYPYIEITIKAYNTAINEKTGEGLLTMAAFCTDVFDGEPSEKLDNNGTPVNKIGYIGGGIGSVVISSSDNEFYFMIPHNELWQAIQNQLQKGGETNDNPKEK